MHLHHILRHITLIRHWRTTARISDLQAPVGRVCFYSIRGYALLLLLFLLLPIIVITPLSFNVNPYFSFTSGMLHLTPEALSVRRYRELLEDPLWIH